MTLIACGLNHKTAPIALRERFAFTAERLEAAVCDLVTFAKANGAAILSTCNRTELYCETELVSDVYEWLAQQAKENSQHLAQHCYLYQDGAAVKHIIRVASGLDSMVLGEPQILGQLKSAVHTAEQADVLGPSLRQLFQYVFSATKKIRTETAIGSNPVSFVSVTMQLAKRIFADLNEASVLIVGAGDTAELALRYFSKQKVKKIYIANRTIERAQKVAEQFSAEVLALADLPVYLPRVDIVITATTSSLPIIGKGALETAFKTRKHRPMLVVDLAVPRNVEPEIAKLEDVYLYSIDDLQAIIQNHWQGREQAASQAEILAETQANQFMQELEVRFVGGTIRAYHDKMDALCEIELERALQNLQSGMPPATVVRQLVHRLRNKVVHRPTVGLRKAAAMGQHQLLEFAQELLDIDKL